MKTGSEKKRDGNGLSKRLLGNEFSFWGFSFLRSLFWFQWLPYIGGVKFDTTIAIALISPCWRVYFTCYIARRCLSLLARKYELLIFIHFWSFRLELHSLLSTIWQVNRSWYHWAHGADDWLPVVSVVTSQPKPDDISILDAYIWVRLGYYFNDRNTHSSN